MANGGGVQAHMNGGLAAPVAHMNGQPQMQAALQAQQQQLSQQQQQQQRVQIPTSQAELMMRAQRMAEQQRNAIQMQQQQHAQQHPQQHQQHMQQQQQQQTPAQQSNVGTPGSQGTQGSPPMRNGVANMNQQNFMNNAQNLLAQYGANGGHGTPKGGLHMPSLAAGSPGQAQARPQPQFPNNISAQLAQLEANFLAKNPSLTPEQTRQLATEHLTRAMMQQRQSAMNAAAGGAAAAALANAQPGIANGMTATTSPHQYAALLRQQQQQQASQAAQSASPVPQAQQIAHQRQSSEGSTPSVPK
jgi:chromatin modification-related protein VID21